MNAKVKVLYLGYPFNCYSKKEYCLDRFSGYKNIDFIHIGSQADISKSSDIKNKINLGSFPEYCYRPLELWHNPILGQKAAIDNKANIEKSLENSDVLILITGLGGSVGTGAAQIITSIAKEMYLQIDAVVTTPPKFEGGYKKITVARNGIEELKKYTNNLYIINQETIVDYMGKDTILNDIYNLTALLVNRKASKFISNYA